MKSLNFLLLLFCLPFLFLISCSNAPENSIGDIDKVKDQIAIKYWRIFGPFTFKTLHKKGDKKETFKADYKLFKHCYYSQNALDAHHIDYLQPKDYVDLNAALHTDSASAFAYCEINSEQDQDVAFLIGIDNNASVWVNDRLVLTASSGNITKNEYPVKVHLNEGRNLIVVGISSNKNAFNFHLDVSAVNYVKKYAFGLNDFSIADHYLVKSKQPITIRLPHPEFFDTTQSANIQIANSTGKIVLNKQYPNGSKWLVPINELTDGAYSMRLISGQDTFKQAFIYGDYKTVFKNICQNIPAVLADRDSININTLIHRFNYLDKFGKTNGYDEVLERKMSAIAFELAQMPDKLKRKESILKFIPGYHIRTYRSAIDNVNNNYAVYYPENYKPGTKLPLIMIMPWVAKQNPFTESWHLAFTDHIEFLEMLARKYGFMIMWQSARVYEHYNLNPIVTSAAFEAFNDLKKDYNIDADKIYLYGTCSGGLQALLMANRFPSLFAAVGVEGPEISYIKSEKGNGVYPLIWTRNNSIVNTASNFSNIPLYIANSKNDWHGAKEPELSQLIKNIKAKNGKVIFDPINNATRSNFVKMVNDNVITDNIFSFFKNKKRSVPDTIKFATYQLKYNNAYWITINDIKSNGLVTIKAWVDKNNNINVKQQNVSSFSIDLNRILKLNKAAKSNVFVNGKLVKPVSSKSNTLLLLLEKDKPNTIKKSHLVEGPINDFFAKRFVLVKPDRRNTVLADTFINNWKYNFFGSCIVRQECQVTTKDLAQSNILLTGTDYHNPIIKSLISKLPVKISKDYIEIAGKKIPGNNLVFTMIYPNPLSPGHYVLLNCGNGKNEWPQQLNNIALSGFYDVMVWDANLHTKVYAQNFDRDWRLK